MTLIHTRGAVGARIETIDALRGFALLGIVLVHMVEQYVASPPPAAEPNLGVFTAADSAVRILVWLLFIGKFFALFSLLFGVSFAMQLDRAAQRGVAFGSRFVWRLAILFVIGMVHHLFYRGDILSIYAALGLLLLPLRMASDRTLLVLAAAVALGAHRVVLAAWAAFDGGGIAVMPQDEQAVETYFAAVRSGAAGALFASNLTEGMTTKLHFLFGWIGRGWQTLALFMLGAYIGRRRWHERLDEMRRPLRLVTWGGIGLAVASAGAGAALFALGLVPTSAEAARPWHYLAALGLYDLFNLGVVAVYGGGFLLLYEGRLRPLLRQFAPVGRTALTSYLAQSAIGVFIFYGIGLGLLGRMPLALAFLLGFVIFAAQVIASRWWVRRFRYGPVEWLWRSLTNWRVEPLRRREAEPAAAAHANP